MYEGNLRLSCSQDEINRLLNHALLGLWNVDEPQHLDSPITVFQDGHIALTKDGSTIFLKWCQMESSEPNGNPVDIPGNILADILHETRKARLKAVEEDGIVVVADGVTCKLKGRRTRSTLAEIPKQNSGDVIAQVVFDNFPMRDSLDRAIRSTCDNTVYASIEVLPDGHCTLRGWNGEANSVISFRLKEQNLAHGTRVHAMIEAHALRAIWAGGLVFRYGKPVVMEITEKEVRLFARNDDLIVTTPLLTARQVLGSEVEAPTQGKTLKWMQVGKVFYSSLERICRIFNIAMDYEDEDIVSDDPYPDICMTMSQKQEDECDNRSYFLNFSCEAKKTKLQSKIQIRPTGNPALWLEKSFLVDTWNLACALERIHNLPMTGTVAIEIDDQESCLRLSCPSWDSQNYQIIHLPTR